MKHFDLSVNSAQLQVNLFLTRWNFLGKNVDYVLITAMSRLIALSSFRIVLFLINLDFPKFFMHQLVIIFHCFKYREIMKDLRSW